MRKPLGPGGKDVPQDRGALTCIVGVPDPSADGALEITPRFGVPLRAVQRVCYDAVSRRVAHALPQSRTVGVPTAFGPGASGVRCGFEFVLRRGLGFAADANT